jgi:hypothetical protein
MVKVMPSMPKLGFNLQHFKNKEKTTTINLTAQPGLHKEILSQVEKKKINK